MEFVPRQVYPGVSYCMSITFWNLCNPSKLHSKTHTDKHTRWPWISLYKLKILPDCTSSTWSPVQARRWHLLGITRVMTGSFVQSSLRSALPHDSLGHRKLNLKHISPIYRAVFYCSSVRRKIPYLALFFTAQLCSGGHQDPTLRNITQCRMMSCDPQNCNTDEIMLWFLCFNEVMARCILCTVS